MRLWNIYLRLTLRQLNIQKLYKQANLKINYVWYIQKKG